MTAHYTSLYAAINMLQSRLATLHALLAKMSSGEASAGSWCATSAECGALQHAEALHAGDVPYNHSLVRQAASLVRQLPAIRAADFHHRFLRVRTCMVTACTRSGPSCIAMLTLA